MNDVVASTGNLYIDTSRTPASFGTTGDRFQLELGALTLKAGDNQLLRMTLVEYNMYKTWTDVNKNNSAFVFTSSAGVAALRITEQNYQTISDLAQNFADTLGAQMVLWTVGSNTFQVSNLKPATTTTINGTTNNIISFQVQAFNGAVVVPHTITLPLIQSFESKGDFYALIGGDRIVDGLSVTPTITATMGAGPNFPLTIQCLYPAQRSTTPFIYIKTNLETASLATSSLDRPSGQDLIPSVIGANILGRVAVNTEFCTYHKSTDGVYYLDLTQKSVSTIQLFLTDEANRPIGRGFGDTARTASGTGLNQSNLGNLTFSAVFRIDVIQVRPKGDILFPLPAPPINSKLSNMTIRPTPPL